MTFLYTLTITHTRHLEQDVYAYGRQKYPSKYISSPINRSTIGFLQATVELSEGVRLHWSGCGVGSPEVAGGHEDEKPLYCIVK